MLTFLIGAAEFPLEEGDARWLERTIRTTCLDAGGRPWDREANAGLQVADVIHEDLARGHSPEPIAVGWWSALGMLHTFHDKEIGDIHARIASSDGLASLYLALRRFARDGR